MCGLPSHGGIKVYTRKGFLLWIDKVTKLQTSKLKRLLREIFGFFLKDGDQESYNFCKVWISLLGF